MNSRPGPCVCSSPGQRENLMRVSDEFGATRRWRRATTCFGLALLLSLALSSSVEARITRIVITRSESPTFGGTSFGAVGQVEKLVGTAFGEVDPGDPHNSIIQDMDLAPRNARGMVEYST